MRKVLEAIKALENGNYIVQNNLYSFKKQDVRTVENMKVAYDALTRMKVTIDEAIKELAIEIRNSGG